MDDPSLMITRIPKLDTVVIKHKGMFITTKDSIVIDVDGLYILIKVLLDMGILNIEELKGLYNE